jgi:predicted ArsR family transcriptional regulator
MPKDRDDFSGRYTREYPVKDFQAAVEDSEDGLSTQEVADIVGCSRDLAYHRLKELEEDGVVEANLVGGSFQWKPRGEDAD